jgi:hypothetical protein
MIAGSAEATPAVRAKVAAAPSKCFIRVMDVLPVTIRVALCRGRSGLVQEDWDQFRSKAAHRVNRNLFAAEVTPGFADWLTIWLTIGIKLVTLRI